MKKNLFLILFVMMAGVTSAQYSAVRVNAAGLATGTLNIGMDVAISEKWSVDVSGYWNPIKTKSLCTNIIAATIGIRYWRFEPHVGFYYGAHILGASYKIGYSNVRYNGWMSGLGCSIGYAWMIAPRWNFSLEGGLGCFYMNDISWNPNISPMDDLTLNHFRRFVLAPSKIDISFSYLF